MPRVLLAALLLSSAGAVLAQTPSAPAPAQAQAPAERLRRLFHDSDEASLRRNPISAIFRGDYRYADRLGDFGSDAYDNAERQAAEEDLAALRAIDRSALNPTDRIAYDVFEYQRSDDLRDLQPDVLPLTRVRPINHFTGFHTAYPGFASGRGAAPFRNVTDYDNNVRRHRQFVIYLDRAIARFREGLASGVVDTKLTIRNVIGQLDTQLASAPEQSPFAGPLASFPEAVPEAERARLRSCSPSSATASTPPIGACAISCRTSICRTPGTAPVSSTCRAAPGSMPGWSSKTRRCR